jgi:hypothetical protein
MAHYGRIINISSSAGRMVSTLGGAHYTASKAGLLGLTRAAAKELGKFGITVNAICPGIIDTELTREHASDQLLERLAASYPVPRLGTALEVADLICFAASEAAGYITGASLDINGGDLMMWSICLPTRRVLEVLSAPRSTVRSRGNSKQRLRPIHAEYLTGRCSEPQTSTSAFRLTKSFIDCSGPLAAQVFSLQAVRSLSASPQ